MFKVQDPVFLPRDARQDRASKKRLLVLVVVCCRPMSLSAALYKVIIQHVRYLCISHSCSSLGTTSSHSSSSTCSLSTSDVATPSRLCKSLLSSAV